MSHVDAWGRTIIDMDNAKDLLYAGGDLQKIFVEPSAAVDRFNELCRIHDRLDFQLRLPTQPTLSPEQEHAQRANRWFLAEELGDLDVREFVISLCSDDVERERIHMEMDLFEQREMLPVLKTMICLVDHFRRNKIIWGVGRGSSVASYVLYKIGVHRIDPLKYNLPINEFMR